jgi:hypothetical protein
METVKLYVGTSVVYDGRQQDNLRPVEFEGELVGSRREHTDERGTRGVDQSLYRCADGRLVVYIEDWSRWQGEPTIRKLVRVRPEDLNVGGTYELLGRTCGMARPLCLDEALEEAEA